MKYICLIVAMLLSVSAYANELQYVIVADPFIELHTGPGDGYPVTHVIERGAEVGVVKRRVGWFLLRSDRDVEGWVNSEQLEQTLQLSGAAVVIPRAGIEEYRDHRWEIGLLAGDFGGATAYTVFGAYGFSRNLALELDVSQILGNFSDGWSATANITHTFVPKWRVSPFVSLGTGIIRIEPKSSLAQTEDRSDQLAVVGVGLKGYLAEKVLLRFEYKGYVVLSSRNDNEDVDEWKAGFAIFF